MSHRRSAAPIRSLAAALLLAGAGTGAAGAATFTVTNTNDSGTNSLRWAIQQANATDALDNIHFAIPGSGTRVIALASALPSLGKPVVIDGSTQAGWTGSPIIRVDGQDDPDHFFGFDVAANGTTIRGLQIVRFAGPGIRVWSTGNTFTANAIGTDGTNDLGNSGSGIDLYGGGNTVGGTAANAGNTISGNGGAGITIDGGSAGNVIRGNRVGTTTAGTAALPNGGGIAVWGDDNTIGGNSAAARNLVSGNDWDGIVIGEAATGNDVQGNFVGTNAAGTAALANAQNGIAVRGTDNQIGGVAAGEGNLLSGNGSSGVRIYDTAASNLVAGNRIGTDVTGAVAVGNQGGGVYVYGDNNIVGATLVAGRNQVSGNAYDGIALGTGADGNLVLGNYVGTNAGGTGALGNAQNGVAVRGANNAVGGTAAGAGNLISGNGSTGVRVYDTALGNFVLGNRIGTNAAGTAALPNQGGINLYGDDNTIGGTTAAARNLISGNGYDGIGISGDAVGNQILGNWIGLDAAGTGKIGNAGYGIRVVDGHDNAIGGTAPGAGNVISGNGRGLSLEYDAHDFTVQGNVLGLNAAANAKIASPGSGIEVSSPGHLIGGSAPGAGNVVAGHGYYGVVLSGAGAHDVRVEGNWIGTNPAGAAGLGNAYMGVLVNEAFGNTIGGTEPGAGNTIAHNGYLGVFVWAGNGNAILGNSIHSNVLLGIELEPQGPFANDPLDADLGANLGQNYPVVTAAELDGADLAIEGFLESKPNREYRIELFSNTGFDPTGLGEGESFLGAVTVTTDALGHAEFSTTLAAAGADAFVAATATDPGGNTSELSPAIAVGAPQAGQLQIWRDVLLSYEGTPGVEVSIVRSHGVAGTVTVDVDTLDDSAVAPGDYGELDTTLTFAPGEVVKTVFVPIVSDGAPEQDEKWYLDLSAPTGGAALGPQNHVLAWLFDASPDWPMFSVGDAQVVEGDGGTRKLVFTITRSSTVQDRTVEFWTSDGSAAQGDDYLEATGQVAFTGGVEERTIEIEILGDSLIEPDEQLYVHLYPLGNSICWDCTGEGRILDDDGGDSDHLFSDDFESGATLEWTATQPQP